MSAAEDSARKRLFGKARRLCSQALEIKRGDSRAASVCAIASCSLGNERQAKRYYNMTAGQRKNQVYQICITKGLNVRE